MEILSKTGLMGTLERDGPWPACQYRSGFGSCRGCLKPTRRPLRLNVLRGAKRQSDENWFDGNDWKGTTDDGQPANTQAGVPTVVALQKRAGLPVRLNFFYGGGNGNLIENWFDGNNWNVTDHGQPANRRVGSAPTVVGWNQPGVPVRLNVFYGGGNGNLIENWFDGNNWNVTDHGQPANTSVMAGEFAMSAVAWTSSACQSA